MAQRAAENQEFFIAEYHALQARLDFARKDLIRTETVPPLAVGVMISWLLTNVSVAQRYELILFAIPVLISVISCIRFISRYRGVHQVEAYLRDLEGELAGAQAPGGYERFASTRPKRAPLLRLSRAIMWAALILGTSYLWIDRLMA